MGDLSRTLPFVLACVCLILAVAGGGSAFATDQLYWIESSKIRSVAVDGTGAGQVLSADDAHASSSLTLDVGNAAMFWNASVDPYASSIWRATLQGDDIVDLSAWVEGAGDLTADPVNAKIYYTDPSDCVPDCGSIWRMNQDGSDKERILMQDTPFAIAVYPAGGKMCWGDQHNNWIRCSNLDGSQIETVVLDTDARGLAIDPTSAKLYWTDEEHDSIRRCNMDGSEIEDLVAGLDQPWGITLDTASGRMYWTDRSAGKIQGARLDGSDLADILTGLQGPRGIAFLPESGDVVPATSVWGVIGLALLLLTTSTIVLLRQRRRSSR